MKKYQLIILIGILIYIVGLGYITTHESIHKQIFLRDGINSKTEINYLTLSGVTIPEKQCSDNCMLQNLINDVVGYNTAIIIFTLWSIFIVYMGFKRLK